MRDHIVLKFLYSKALYPEQILPNHPQASRLDLMHLQKQHRLLLQFQQYFLSDSIVVKRIQQQLELLDLLLLRLPPYPQIRLFPTHAHLPHHVTAEFYLTQQGLELLPLVFTRVVRNLGKDAVYLLLEIPHLRQDELVFHLA